MVANAYVLWLGTITASLLAQAFIPLYFKIASQPTPFSNISSILASCLLLFHQVNGVQVSLAFFLGLNAIVCLWEISLFLQIDLIERKHRLYTKQVSAGASALSVATRFFTLPVHTGNVFSSQLWAEVWAYYSVFDASYANRQSFGFFVDVGNGFTTLIPTVLFCVAMTAHGDASQSSTAIALESAAASSPVFGVVSQWLGAVFGSQLSFMSARTMGILGIASFWQELYGTLVYFFSFIRNKRCSKVRVCTSCHRLGN